MSAIYLHSPTMKHTYETPDIIFMCFEVYEKTGFYNGFALKKKSVLQSSSTFFSDISKTYISLKKCYSECRNEDTLNIKQVQIEV